ncbi:hypothetical protein N474_07810 [Pseudoalteromonas luteoviolacea CPMOR-2]|uniref:Uncharacterized protein n=1 Tax=Pseudoalteromonas luteoviolacea DSM 6061 TaxID=1365250 RepID=A0A166X4V4_9GAMM|nr:hypothetical protein N475_14420 [Pseudoalteromonas luteoviolacea DSM 6061]KZN57876.1 hypothetical protein N474_07810 [Pseudoalteromonas luteoviolacea CPMOR-2]
MSPILDTTCSLNKTEFSTFNQQHYFCQLVLLNLLIAADVIEQYKLFDIFHMCNKIDVWQISKLYCSLSGEID